METPKGLRRCECLPEVSKPRANAPVLTDRQATVFVEMLASIPFFPAEAGARLAIGDELRAMCKGPHEADWLVTRMRRLYRRWPGPLEMRHVYASKLQPWDGVQPLGISEAYPDGIPSETEAITLMLSRGRPNVKLLAGGQLHEVIEDPKTEAAVRRMASQTRRMPKARPVGDAAESRLREIITAPEDRRPLPGPTPQIITQADVEREVQKLHAAKVPQPGMQPPAADWARRASGERE